MILFLSIGARQGFGLYFPPVHAELAMAREEFSRAVAAQYLLWGLVGPVAGMLAERYSAKATLIVGGTLYTAGLLAAATANSSSDWLLSAGTLIGLGLGGASFGVVTAAVLRSTPQAKRGSALGVLGALTALGQLLLLLYTEWTIQELGWRGSLSAMGLLTAAIVPLAIVLHRAGPSSPTSAAEPASAASGWSAIVAAVRQPIFWFMGLGFAFSGFHVMFTMTHTPAWFGDLGLPPSAATQALAAISLTSFVGSWAWGRLCDRFPAKNLLVCIYAMRAVMALLATTLTFTQHLALIYFALLGLVWMATIPVTSHLTAQLFGNQGMASVYGTVFMLHQAGGFVGTWLGGAVFDRSGTYLPMWYLIAALCALGAGLAWLIRAGHGAQATPRSPSATLPRD